MKEETFSSSERITFGIFYFLLLVRLTDTFTRIIVGDYAPIVAYYYVLITILLITMVIWLNKEHLKSLHIDGFFIYTFLALGLLVFLLYGISWLGVGGCVSALFILHLLIRKKLSFENKSNLAALGSICLLGVAPILLLRLFSSEPSLFINNFFALEAIRLFELIFKVLWGVVYEELLFRGMLWMLLEKLKLSTVKILLTQAFLFWIAHPDLVSTVSFWTFLPLMSLWLGFLVLRSKSLFPSIITHFSYNLISHLIRGS